MKQRTLKSWNKRGRRVDKGSKAVGFNKDGSALFSKDQTSKRKIYWDDDYSMNYDEGDCCYDLDIMDYDLGLCGQV